MAAVLHELEELAEHGGGIAPVDLVEDHHVASRRRPLRHDVLDPGQERTTMVRELEPAPPMRGRMPSKKSSYAQLACM